MTAKTPEIFLHQQEQANAHKCPYCNKWHISLDPLKKIGLCHDCKRQFKYELKSVETCFFSKDCELNKEEHDFITPEQKYFNSNAFEPTNISICTKCEAQRCK